VEPLRKFFQYDYLKLAIPLAVLLLTLLAGWVARRLLFSALHRWGVKSASRVDLLITKTLSGPIMIWALILGLYFATQSSELPARVAGYVALSLGSLWIVSLTIMAVELTGSLVKFYGGRVAGDLPATSLTKNLAQLFVIIVGALILLRELNIDITPLLTALGVGGLAVALALQDTLSNLFGGFYVSIAGQVRLGDYIKINTGEEGYITDITWRSTSLRALNNTFIIVPNSKLAQAIVTNYNLPEKRMIFSIRVSAGYDSDADRVEQVLLEETTAAAGSVAGLLAEPAPSVRFLPGFGDSALEFTLNVQIGEFADQFPVQHELRKRILRRFRQEGIDMPFPTRTVHLLRDDDASETAAQI